MTAKNTKFNSFFTRNALAFFAKALRTLRYLCSGNTPDFLLNFFIFGRKSYHMQKRKCWFALLLLVGLNCFGQNNHETIVFSAGPSFPLGSFGSSNNASIFASPLTGFANPGESVAISYYSKRKGQFGFTAAAQADRNPLNIK